MIFESVTRLILYQNGTFLGDFSASVRAVYDKDCDGLLEASERAELESALEAEPDAAPAAPGSFLDHRPWVGLHKESRRIVGFEGPSNSTSPFIWSSHDIVTYPPPDAKMNHSWTRPAPSEGGGMWRIVAPPGYTLQVEGLAANATTTPERTVVFGWREASADVRVEFSRIPVSVSFTPVAARNLTLALADVRITPSTGEIESARLIEWGDSNATTELVHRYARPGEYVVNVSVTDSANMTGTRSRVVLIEHTPPAAAFTTTNEDAYVLSFDAATSVPGDGLTLKYAWNFGDATTGEGRIARHVYAGVGPFNVTLTVTDENGAAGRLTRTVTPVADAAPLVPMIGVDIYGQYIVANASSSFDTNGAIVGYEWDWGDNSPRSSGVQASHLYAKPGKYTLTLSVVRESGARVTGMAEVAIEPPRATPAVGVGGIMLLAILCALWRRR